MDTERKLTDLVSLLRDILHPDRIEEMTDGVISLSDDESGMSYSLEDVPSNAIAIRLDRIRHFGSAWKEGLFTRSCDHIVVFPSEADTWTALFVEMKKSDGKFDDACEQLRQSPPIFRYLQGACEVHSRQSFTVNFCYAFVCWRAHRLDKQPFRAKPFEEPYRDIVVRIHLGEGTTFEKLVN